MELIIFIISFVIFTISFKFISQKLNWKLSWLLPITLGFTVAILLTTSISIFLEKKHAPLTKEVVINDKKIVEDFDTSNMTDKDAYIFAQQLFFKITDDSEYVEQAYKNNDLNKLNRYIKEWDEFAHTPFSKVEMQKPNGLPYFPNTPLMDHYVKCDTAFMDLNLMANAYYYYLRDKTESLEKIKIKQEQKFRNSKAECEKIISSQNLN
ncbi:hypothetical protein [Acinetobacter sp. ANC 5502]